MIWEMINGYMMGDKWESISSMVYDNGIQWKYNSTIQLSQPNEDDSY